jgi:hypothetical protein
MIGTITSASHEQANVSRSPAFARLLRFFIRRQSVDRGASPEGLQQGYAKARRVAMAIVTVTRWLRPTSVPSPFTLASSPPATFPSIVVRRRRCSRWRRRLARGGRGWRRL